MMTRKQTLTSLTLAGATVLATLIIASISIATPVKAIGHFDKPDGLADFSGLPTSDNGIDLKGLLAEALKSESEGIPVGEDSSRASAVGGFPNDETDAAGTPEQDSPTNDKEEEQASPVGSDDNSKGSVDSDKVGYEELQACLSNTEGKGSPTEQEVQDCIGSSYGERVGSDNPPADNTAEGNEDENSVTEHVSDNEEEEGEEEEEDDFE